MSNAKPGNTVRIIQLVLSGLFGLLGVAVLIGGGDVAPVGAPLAFTAAIVAGLSVPFPRMGVLAAGLGGAGASAYLFLHKLEENAGPSLCAVNEVFDCDAVNASGPSEFLGVPISLFGLGFYLSVAAVSLFKASQTPRFYQALSLFGIGSVVYSVWLAWQSHTLGLICLFCMSMWAANLLLMLGGLRGLAEEGGKLFTDLMGVATSRSLIVITALFLVITAIGATRWMGQSETVAIAAPGEPANPDEVDLELLGKLYSKPHGRVAIDGTEPVLGDPAAPYEIVEFADFRCGHCANASRFFEAMIHEDSTIQVRFKVFPLTGKCNPLIPEENGTWDQCYAAGAADCARQQGKFWEMAHTLFENPKYFQPDDLVFMAGQLELDVDAFQTCMDDPSTLGGVVADAQAGIEVKVEGTPTLFLRLPGSEEFIQITAGPEALYYIIQAHKAGIELPAPQILPAPY